MTKTKSQDWFDANIVTLQPLIEAKRDLLLEHHKNPTTGTLAALRLARSRVKEECIKCANKFWLDLCSTIQIAADTGNIRAMFEGIRKAIGPTQTKCAPLKSLNGELIQDKAKQLERWVEHYSQLYDRENLVSATALDQIERLPTMPELDNAPTLDELLDAIKGIPSGKATGSDGIPAELFKCSGDQLHNALHCLLCKCWEEGAVPQEMRDSIITTLYKSKGDCSDCNNYRGISLLCIAGKLFARVALRRLKQLAERVYPESQCGFRSQRSTVDMIFSVRQLQEKCREQQQPLFIAFIDLTKAFDLVSRDGLFKILPLIGCPPKLLSFLESFHNNMHGTVRFDGNMSEAFNIRSGVKQGCVLAPTLFGIFFSVLLKHAFRTTNVGILLRSRTDGKLFNLARLRWKTKVSQVLLRDFLFADDAALVAHSDDDLQNLLDDFSNACDDFGLTISLQKTKIMTQGTDASSSLSIKDYALEVVNSFTYLGSTITRTTSLDSEIGKRIGYAATNMSKLSQRVWENQKLTIPTKMAVYRACIISTLLYGSESWTTYAAQEKRLNVFHLRCLRRILSISWQDRITNSAVLERAGIPSVFTLLRQRRLRWTGHVFRMDEGRIPKHLLYGELVQGKRPVGRPKLRFKDVVKRDMQAISLSVDSWESLASDRSVWKTCCIEALREGEKCLNIMVDTRRERQKARALATPTPTDSAYVCGSCHRICRSRIGLQSHRRKCLKK